MIAKTSISKTPVTILSAVVELKKGQNRTKRRRRGNNNEQERLDDAKHVAGKTKSGLD